MIVERIHTITAILEKLTERHSENRRRHGRWDQAYVDSTDLIDRVARLESRFPKSVKIIDRSEYDWKQKLEKRVSELEQRWQTQVLLNEDDLK